MIRIGGFQKTSLLDFPDYISAIVWTVGCNFRCPFCYNKNLVLGKGDQISEDEILSFLKKRQGLIEGVVISGGEPLMQEDVVDFIGKIKKLGFLVKVDTNGCFPDVLKTLFDNNSVDYVAMDIKAPKKKYPDLCGGTVDMDLLEKSIDLIKTRAPVYEFRTTFVPPLLIKEDIIEIAHWLDGADRFYLQQFKLFAPLVSSKMETVKPYDKKYLQETIDSIKPYFKRAAFRGI
jgi:pyruvate formate lyase activating enzyme